ncbi:MAG: amidophosphoribosyltransferase [Planctomycetota bacterium]
MPKSPARVALPQLPAAVDPGCGGWPDAGEKKEKCAVFGVWGTTDPVGHAYTALYAQQHRGQESAGIAGTSGRTITGHTGMGLVAEVFDELTLVRLRAADPVATIGHNRYSTTGESSDLNAQPLVQTMPRGQIALAHNGNLVNARAMRRRFGEQGHLFRTTSDTEVIIHLLAGPEQQAAPDPVAATLRRLQGAFSLLMLFEDRLEAARDPWGFRPLALGTMPDGSPVVASETVAFDVLGATFEREVEPGEIVTLGFDGVSSRRFAPAAERTAMCVFEHVYFASPASTVFGQNVQTFREDLGATLWAEDDLLRDDPPDYVMPMPDSGRSAANGYARASGVPYREGIVPNRYVGRTFIKPTQGERETAVRLKLNVIGEIVRGKRVVVVDDSIVRGTTTRLKMRQIYDAGAAEIHLRISCPPIRHPCYFGVDFARKNELVANGRDPEQIRQFLGVDSLRFLSLDGMLGCAAHGPDRYCTACWSGEYRIDVHHPTTEQFIDPDQGRMFANGRGEPAPAENPAARP